MIPTTPPFPPLQRLLRSALRSAKQAKQVTRLLTEGGYVITPENPGGLPASRALNAERRRAMKADLRARGIDPIPVAGGYTDDQTGQLLTERGYHLPEVDPVEAGRLAQQYGQNSLLTPEGLVSIGETQMRLTPRTGIRTGDRRTLRDTYTEVPGGKRFAYDLDWSQSRAWPDSARSLLVSLPRKKKP